MPTEYALYLRKSRADLEAEAHGEGDTLARHEHILMELAKSRALPIGAIYREIVSGERIANRPVMQQLLAEVEDGRWKGVLVTETSRLARGDTIDQGIVAQAFKFSGTLIVTPSKTYNPTQEADEEWMEFGLFMSRQEYRMIRRRQLAGTRASKKEGHYVPGRPPYGYERYKLDGRGWSLRPVEPQAGVIRTIYDMYLSGKGFSEIANELNAMKIRTPLDKKWVPATTRAILQNPHYAGFIPSAMKVNTKIVQKGKLITKRPVNKNCELYEGIHEAIIPRDVWYSVQQRMKDTVTPRVPRKYQQMNPLAGLVYCDQCGKLMSRHPYRREDKVRFGCENPSCSTVSSLFEDVESLVLQSLREFLHKIELSSPTLLDTKSEEIALQNIEKQLTDINRRLQRTYELLEDGVYSKETFLQRQSAISQDQTALLNTKHEIERKLHNKQTDIEAQKNSAPLIRHVLDVYPTLEDPKEQNLLLKQVIRRIDYHKTVRVYGKAKSDLHLTIHPKIAIPQTSNI